MKLLLTAPPKTGKTNVLKNLLSLLSKSSIKYDGCYVSEFLDDNNKRIGFKIIYLNGLRSESILSSKISTFDNNIIFGKHNVNLDAIVEMIDYLNSIPPDIDLLIFDEIGKMQNLHLDFITNISNILGKFNNIIATIVYDDNLFQHIKNEYLTINVTPENRNQLPDDLFSLIDFDLMKS